MSVRLDKLGELIKSKKPDPMKGLREIGASAITNTTLNKMKEPVRLTELNKPISKASSGLFTDFPDLPDFQLTKEHKERMKNALYYATQFRIPPEMAYNMEPELTKQKDNLIKDYDLSSDIGKAIAELPENLKIGTIGLAASTMYALKRRGMWLAGGGIFPDEMVRRQFEPVKPVQREQLPNLPGFIRPTTSDWPLSGALLAESVGLVTRLPDIAGKILSDKEQQLAQKQDRVTLQNAPITKSMRSVVQGGVPSMAAAIGAAVLTGDPIVALALLGEMEGGSAFQTQLESGASISKANIIGNLSEAAEIGGEMLVLPKIIKGVKEGATLREAFNTIIENTVQEGWTGFNQRFLEVFGQDTSKGKKYQESIIHALNEGVKAIPENAWVGGATAGIPAAIRGGYDIARPKATTEAETQAQARLETLTPPKEAIIEQPAPEQPVEGEGKKPEVKRSEIKTIAKEIKEEVDGIRTAPLSTFDTDRLAPGRAFEYVQRLYNADTLQDIFDEWKNTDEAKTIGVSPEEKLNEYVKADFFAQKLLTGLANNYSAKQSSAIEALEKYQAKRALPPAQPAEVKPPTIKQQAEEQAQKLEKEPKPLNVEKDIEEDELPSITSARQAMIAEDRKALGLDEMAGTQRKSWQKSLSNANKKGIPDKATRIAQEVNENPRALDDEETAGLVIRAARLKNEYKSLMTDINRADDAEMKSLSAEAERIENEFEILSRAIHLSGTKKGQALAAQKLTIDQDFNLISVKSRAKAAKGKALTAQESTKLTETTNKLEQAQAKIEELERKINEMAAKRAVKEQGLKRYSKMSLEQKDTELNQDIKRLNELIKEGCL